MRVRYSFSSKKTRRARDPRNLRKQKQKYPSLMEKIVETSDIVLEVLDARFVQDTRNLEIEEVLKKNGKKIIYVLNKADLVEKIKRKDLKDLNPYVVVSCSERRGIKELRDLIKQLSGEIEKKQKKMIKGFKVKESRDERITVGVIGYPNTGKSSLINLLIGKSSAGTGSDAGFTKGFQKLRLTSDIHLIDSPGVIPKEEYSSSDKEAISRHTKVGGRSYSQVKDPEIVVANLMREFPEVFEEHYKIDAGGNSEILLEEIGKKKGFFKKKGEVNFDKVARIVLKDWQIGKIKI